MQIPRLPSDKEGHLIMGLLLFCVFGFIDPVLGLCIAVAAGILKECNDWYSGGGCVDFWDFVATSAGGALGFFCTTL